ncbi:MAG: hypothetical protein JWR26_1224 [Pedosphaera sp.]|nr:hypothetical protein [Pedosphaera sp.]
MSSHILTKTSAFKRALSLLCLAVFVSLQALAASPVLHDHFHHDAGKADHNCIVTLLTQGSIDATACIPLIVQPTGFVIEAPVTFVSVSVSADYQLLPGRAPPSLWS